MFVIIYLLSLISDIRVEIAQVLAAIENDIYNQFTQVSKTNDNHPISIQYQLDTFFDQ